MLSSDSHKAWPQKDMTFDTLDTVNKNRGYLRRYGKHSFGESYISPIKTGSGVIRPGACFSRTQ